MRSPHAARKSSPGSLQLEKAQVQQWRSTTAKNKYILKMKKKMEKKMKQGFLGGSVVKNSPGMQMTWFWFLIREDPTHHRATMPVHHNYWVCALEPRSRDYWAHVPQLLRPVCPRARALQKGRPSRWEACTWQLESSLHLQQLDKSPCSNKDLAWPKINK